MYELNLSPQDIGYLLEGLLFSRLALPPVDDPLENHDRQLTLPERHTHVTAFDRLDQLFCNEKPKTLPTILFSLGMTAMSRN
jgi:hypothetical protein